MDSQSLGFDPRGSPVSLPPDQYEAYMSLKADTNFVLDWLRVEAEETSLTPFGEKLSIKDILTAGRMIRQRKLEAPTFIQNAFKRLLRARRKLTEWFREGETRDGNGQSSSTDSHEFFNNTIAQIYDMVCPRKATANSDNEIRGIGPSKSSQRNFYEVLADIGQDDDGAGMDLSDREADTQDSQQSTNAAAETKEYVIEDDPLRDRLDPSAWLYELDVASSLAREWWAKARDGSMPVVVASWLTTQLIDFMVIKSVVWDTRMGGYTQVMRKLSNLLHVKKKNGELLFKSPRLISDFQSGVSFVLAHGAMKKFRASNTDNLSFTNIAERQKVHDYFLTETHEHWIREQLLAQVDNKSTREDQVFLQLAIDHRYAKDRDALFSILKSVWRGEFGPGIYSDQERECVLPLKPLIEYLQGKGCGGLYCPCNGVPCLLVFYLHVILDSCREFVWIGENPNPINCRMQALKLGQEITASISLVEGIDTSHSLTKLKSYIKDLLSTPRFDLLFQSPVIAGRQNLILAHCAMGAGIQLLNQKGIFGTVLYLYKVSQLATGGQKGNHLVLDRFCEVFRNVIFMGTYPRSNFKLVWMRFMQWDPNLMKDAGKKTRLKAEDISPWYLGELGSNDLNGKFWNSLRPSDERKRMSKGQLLRLEREMKTKPIESMFLDLRLKIQGEFQGDFQIPRIDFFTVYIKAFETISKLGEKFVQIVEPSLVSAAPHGVDEYLDTGLGIAMELFSDLDDMLGSGTPLGGYKMAENKGIRILQEVLVEVWGKTTVEDLYWKNI